MNPDEKAKDIIAQLMEYTPDHLIPDNETAYEVCKIHALILAEAVKGHAASQSYWQDVVDCLKEGIDPLVSPQR